MVASAACLLMQPRIIAISPSESGVSRSVGPCTVMQVVIQFAVSVKVVLDKFDCKLKGESTVRMCWPEVSLVEDLPLLERNIGTDQVHTHTHNQTHCSTEKLAQAKVSNKKARDSSADYCGAVKYRKVNISSVQRE